MLYKVHLNKFKFNFKKPLEKILISISIRSWRKKWQPTPIILPGKPHGQRSLMGLQSMESQKSWTQLK